MTPPEKTLEKLTWKFYEGEDVWRAYRYAFEYEIEQSEDGWDIQINFENSVADCPNLDVFSTAGFLREAKELCQCHADAAERPFLSKTTLPATDPVRRELVEALQVVASLYEKSQDTGTTNQIAMIAYDMRCVARTALAREREVK